MDDTDMDSLFEGMVLFDPNSSFSEEPEQVSQEELHDVVSVKKSTVVAAVDDRNGDIPTAVAPRSSLDTASSEPLDESLFSELTIVSPIASATTTASDTTTTTTGVRETPSVISRQVSRKKRRASLRIGYGRDSSSATAAAADDDGGDEAHTHAQFDSGESPSVIANGDCSSRDDRGGDADSDEDRLERIKAGISEKLDAARRSVAAVLDRRKEAIAGRRSAAERLRAASEARAELERRLNEACEAEDFEAAERLSDSLAAADEERLSLVAALREAEAQCDAVEATMEEALASQIAAEEECSSLLDGFAKDASNEADLVTRTAQEASSKQMETWASSTEALEVRRMELEISSHVVNEARAGLDTSIEHLVEDDKRERESLCKKKDVLMDELEKLLVLVKQKEQEIAETDSNIEAVDKKIADVVSGFQEMQSDIESNVGNLQSVLSEIELESGALVAQKKEIDEVLSREEEKGAKLRELANASAEEAKTYLDVVGLRKNLMVSALKAREDKVRLAKTEEKLSDEVQLFRQEISTARASLQELSARKSSIQQDIASSKQKILFIDKRIPELEAEKKVAATARNFKEAARIAAEAKSLTVEKDSIQVETERVVKELDKLEGDIVDTLEKLQETEALVLSKEKEVAMARFERLLLIAGSATAERAAALEFGNQAEANLLLAEAEAADSEAKKLQPVYDLRVEEFTNIPKHFISMELVANLDKKQLEELAASVQVQLSPAL